MIYLSFDELVNTLEKNKDINDLSSQLQKVNSNVVHSIPNPTPSDVTTHSAMRVSGNAAVNLEEFHAPSPLAALMVNKAVKQVYKDDEITPLQMAKLLKQLDYSMDDITLAIHQNYPNQTVEDLVTLLLDPEMYPQTTKLQVTNALYSAGFDQNQIDPVVNEHFPSQSIEAKADFSNRTIQTTNLTITTGPGMVYNEYYKHSWKMLYPGRSFLEAKFNATNVNSNVDLILVNLTSSMGSQPGYSPVDIVINGKLFKDNYNPGSMNYKKDIFKIGSFLFDGENTLRIEFQSHPWAKTHYWIQSLEIKG